MTSLLNESGTKRLGLHGQHVTKNPKNNITGSKRAGTTQSKLKICVI